MSSKPIKTREQCTHSGQYFVYIDRTYRKDILYIIRAVGRSKDAVYNKTNAIYHPMGYAKYCIDMRACNISYFIGWETIIVWYYHHMVYKPLCCMITALSKWIIWYNIITVLFTILSNSQHCTQYHCNIIILSYYCWPHITSIHGEVQRSNGVFTMLCEATWIIVLYKQ